MAYRCGCTRGSALRSGRFENSPASQEAGFTRGIQIYDPSHRTAPKYESYRAPSVAPRVTEHIVSAPIGGRGILANVRAGSIIGPNQGGSLDHVSTSKRAQASGAGTGTFRRGGTMTKGTGKSKRSGMHALAWMPSVTVGEKKEGSGPDSLTSSRMSLDPSLGPGTRERGSESPQTHPSNSSDVFDSEATPSWAEE
jgi:hypothetical protein